MGTGGPHFHITPYRSIALRLLFVWSRYCESFILPVGQPESQLHRLRTDDTYFSLLGRSDSQYIWRQLVLLKLLFYGRGHCLAQLCMHRHWSINLRAQVRGQAAVLVIFFFFFAVLRSIMRISMTHSYWCVGVSKQPIGRSHTAKTNSIGCFNLRAVTLLQTS